MNDGLTASQNPAVLVKSSHRPMPESRPECPRCKGVGNAISVEASPGKLVVTYVCQECGHQGEVESADPLPEPRQRRSGEGRNDPGRDRPGSNSPRISTASCSSNFASSRWILHVTGVGVRWGPSFEVRNTANQVVGSIELTELRIPAIMNAHAGFRIMPGRRVA
jgi:hypothetical protein